MGIPLTKPFIPKTQVNQVLKSGWLTEGKYVRTLEEKICKYLNIKHALMVNSATSGLIMAVRVLRLRKVIIPDFTFPATYNAVILGRAKPILKPVNRETYNLETKDSRPIMAVHQFGLCTFTDCLIEDAACAFGAEYHGKKAGTFAEIGVFSFHPRKIITCGEGGCVVTNDDNLAKELKALRNHGEGGVGYNFRLTDIQASVLLPQLEMIEDLIAHRIELAHNYNRLLGELAPYCPEHCRHIYQSYVIKIEDRDRVKGSLSGIETQIGTYSLGRNKYLQNHTLALPLYHTLTFRQQKYIVNKLKQTLEPFEPEKWII